MKVAIIGVAYPYRGGLAAYNERLAREFQKAEHEVTLYTFKLQYPKFLFPGKTQYSTEQPPEGLQIKRCINSVNPLNWLFVGKEIADSKPDLVIIKFWIPFMGASFGSILRRIKWNGHSKVIAIIDNMIPHEARIGDRVLSKFFVKPVDAFVAMSESVLSDIETFDPIKPKTLTPHPLFDNFGEPVTREEALKKLNLPQDHRYILFFGLIREYKGLDLLIKAFADSRFRQMGLKVIVAGEFYSDKKHYTDLIESFDLHDDIILTEKFIPDSEVKYYFNAADLVVQPYKSATQSGVTQIAYHFNKPMIVTDVGGLAELCPDGKVGYVVSVDVGEIADAIVRFYSEENADRFEDNIEEEKAKYSWRILVDKILMTFKEL